MIRSVSYSNQLRIRSRTSYLRFLNRDTAIEHGGIPDGTSYDECPCAYMRHLNDAIIMYLYHSRGNEFPPDMTIMYDC